MDILNTVEERFADITKAAGEFLERLPGTNIKTDVALSAEMAGLMFLRGSAFKLPDLEPGSMILGAVSDEAYEAMNRFIFGWAELNELDAANLENVEISDDDSKYIPSLIQFEQPFYEVCKQNGIEQELFPYVAATSALRAIAAGQHLKLLDSKLALTILLYHVISGSKTIPYPPVS